MVLLIGFAFLAGIVTILSPCILPVLPIVLSGSVTGGKRRPWGIVTGFIVSFTFFTLFLSALVRVTGISPDALRTLSVVVLFLFGVSLLIPQTSVWLEMLFSRLASRAPGQSAPREGFGGGLLIGLSLGLIWTPCVGPILASVISLALTGSVTGEAVLITLAYSLGTAGPMLAITYGGRTLLQKVPWLLRNTIIIQKFFGVLMVVVALAIYLNLDRSFQTYILEKIPQYGVGLTRFEDNDMVRKELEGVDKTHPPRPSATPPEEGNPLLRGVPRQLAGQGVSLIAQDLGNAPELIPDGQWFNSEPLTLASLRGKVVLVDFWTYTCINCIRTLPYLRTWDEKYRDEGLVIIGVHTPEFEFEKNPENLERAIADFDLNYPIVQDNAYATWRAYNNRYWPAKYLVDSEGRIRYTHFGEGAYDETEKNIQDLLADAGARPTADIDNPDYEIYSRTPELYLGYDRIEYLASPEPIRQDTALTYSVPSDFSKNHFAYEGIWTVGAERAMPHAGARLILNFEAREVFLVMRPRDTRPGTIRVLLDEDAPSASTGEDVNNGVVTVVTDRLYKLIQLSEAGTHTLRLEFLDDNLELYAFTFG